MEQHYREVRARLYGPQPPVLVLRRLVAPQPVPIVEPVVSKPIVRRPPRVRRDYIYIRPRGAGISPAMGGIWKPVEAEIILRETADWHEVSVAEIKGPARSRRIVNARYEVFYRLNKELFYSLPMIGKFIGGRDHSGVLHGVRRHEAKLLAAKV